MMNAKALILLVSTLAFGVAPFVTPPFTGYDPAMFPVYIVRPSIQPAGYAFAIWSVIYLWLIAHAVYGLWKRAGNAAWDAVRLPLAVAVAVGMLVGVKVAVCVTVGVRVCVAVRVGVAVQVGVAVGVEVAVAVGVGVGVFVGTGVGATTPSRRSNPPAL